MKTILVIIAVVILALAIGYATAQGNSENYTPLADWESPKELKDWLEQDTSTDTLYITSGESFNGQCENLAFQLEESAAMSGKHLRAMPINRWEIIRWWIQFKYSTKQLIGYWEYHMICGGTVNNNGSLEWWYVEPCNDKHWKVADLD